MRAFPFFFFFSIEDSKSLLKTFIIEFLCDASPSLYASPSLHELTELQRRHANVIRVEDTDEMDDKKAYFFAQ
jgi:hypothetical protein